MPESIEIRRMQKDEIALLVSLIKEMAEFEELLSEVEVDEDVLASEIFDMKRVEAVMVELEEKVIGYCLYFYNFSSFMGRAGLYIEDIYIKPEYRGKGFGQTAFSYLEEKARSEGCRRMEWACLNWNKNAIRFYEKNGAHAMDEWLIYRKKLI